jgi:hypothetical protein
MQRRSLRKTALYLMAALVLVVPLALLGCDSGDEDDDDGGLRDAEPGDLQNSVFVFNDGGVFDPNLDGQEVVLTVGAFGAGALDDDEAAFTITAGGNRATGVITVGSCDLRVATSDFGIAEGPQVDDLIFWDPCEFNEETEELCAVNEDTDEETCSEPRDLTGTGGGGS